MTDDSEIYLREAITLAYANAETGGRPFGAVIVRDGKVVARAVNAILETGDPTSHAELNAIRLASETLGADLRGCAVFASGHPCPMCMAAMRLAGIEAVTYAYSNEDGEPYGLSTAAMYDDLAKPFAQQTMDIRHLPVRLDGKPDLYAGWRQRQG